MKEVLEWIQYKEKTFILRDWADGKSVCAIGDARSKTDKENFAWVGITSNPNNPEDWRFLSLDVVMMSLSDLFGKDVVRDTLDKVVSYDKIKEQAK